MRVWITLIIGLLLFSSCKKEVDQFSGITEGSWKVVKLEYTSGEYSFLQDFITRGFSLYYTFTDTAIITHEFVGVALRSKGPYQITKEGKRVHFFTKEKYEHTWEINSISKDTLKVARFHTKDGTEPIEICTMVKVSKLSDSLTVQDDPQELQRLIKEEAWKLIDYSCVMVPPQMKMVDENLRERLNENMKYKIDTFDPLYVFYDSLLVCKEQRPTDSGTEEEINHSEISYVASTIEERNRYGDIFLQYRIIGIVHDTATFLATNAEKSLTAIFTFKKESTDRDSLYARAMNVVYRPSKEEYRKQRKQIDQIRRLRAK